MSNEDIYRSRWDVCDCGCVTIIENPDGVPENDEWDGFPQCLVCGSSLTMGNADRIVVADAEYAKGKRALGTLLLAWIDEQRQALPEHRTPVAHGKAELLRDLSAFVSMRAGGSNEASA